MHSVNEMATINTRVLFERQLPSGVTLRQVIVKELDPNTQLSDNFRLCELANNLAQDNVKAILNNDVVKHIAMLQAFRTRLGRPCNVSSWYRTQNFNREVGGSANSLHLRALATDIVFPKMSDTLYEKIEVLWRAVCQLYGAIGGINRYTNGVHLSSREDLLGYDAFVTRDYRGKKGDW